MEAGLARGVVERRPLHGLDELKMSECKRELVLHNLSVATCQSCLSA